jgi:hypothetical protein
MGNISVGILAPALQASPNPLAGDLVSRLQRQAPTRVRATRAYSRQAALKLYERKAAKGDGPWVRTDGYPILLATLEAVSERQLIVHGVTFADAVYLVFTDPTRQHCLGVLRKRRLTQGT